MIISKTPMFQVDIIIAIILVEHAIAILLLSFHCIHATAILLLSFHFILFFLFLLHNVLCAIVLLFLLLVSMATIAIFVGASLHVVRCVFILSSMTCDVVVVTVFLIFLLFTTYKITKTSPCCWPVI